MGERLVSAMTPRAIEITLAVRAQLQARLDDADRLRLMQVERAQQEARLARRRYMQIDPDNRLVDGLKTVSSWARNGRLRGRRCGKMIRARWMFEPIDEQPQPVRQLAAARSMGERRGRLPDAAAGRGVV